MQNVQLTGHKSSYAENPEAGDTHQIGTIPIFNSAQTSTYWPSNLLRGYPMQWALNRKLFLTNINETIRVNAYKLGSQSSLFRTLLRCMKNEKCTGLKNVQDKDVDELDRNSLTPVLDSLCADPMVTTSEQQPLLVFCRTPTAIPDLLLAIHFSHIGNCHIEGTTQISCSDYKSYHRVDALSSCLSEVIYWTDQLWLFTDHSLCSLKCGLRVAHTYGLRGMRDLCLEYIREKINPSNCWELWRATLLETSSSEREDDHVLNYVDEEAIKTVRDYIQSHFSEVMAYVRDMRLYDLREKPVTYTDLNVNEVECMLASDRLNASEGEVLQAIQHWLQNTKMEKDITLTLVSAPRLLSTCVRIPMLNLERVESIYQHPFLRQPVKMKQLSKYRRGDTSHSIDHLLSIKKLYASRTKCLTAYRQARRRLLRSVRNLRPLEKVADIQKEGKLKEHQNRAIMDIKTETTESMEVGYGARLPHEAIFIFGGWQKGKPCRNVCVFDARRQRWLNYGPEQNSQQYPSDHTCDRIILPYDLMSFGITLVNNRYVYVAGGELINKHTTSDVIRLDFFTDDSTTEGRSISQDRYGAGWKLCPPLHESRRDLVLVNVMNQKLFALGGDNNRRVLNTTEYYDLDQTNHAAGWKEAPGMLIARGAPAADSIQGVVYVCGGYTESRMEALTNSCEAFTLETNQWTLIQPMNQARYYAQALTVGEVLFVLGGGSDNEERSNRIPLAIGYSSTVERYNPKEGIWELMPPSTERADFAACYFQGELFCLGGGGEMVCTDEVERWDPWLPDTSNPPTVGELSSDITSQVPGETQGPMWLIRNLRQSTTNSMQWTRCVKLPFPTWGHRGIVLKGVDHISPYLGREESDEPEASTQFRGVDSGKCVLFHGFHMLVVSDKSLRNASDTGHNDGRCISDAKLDRSRYSHSTVSFHMNQIRPKK